MTMSEYNGWRNYQTWNVCLWLSNDEGLHRLANSVRSSRDPYEQIVQRLVDVGLTETLDGVRWDDERIDHSEVNDMLNGTL